mmetsp:Transcript_2538/g.3451  ORF Transcript_2538/g.3451 Transcript_2538/m.3451 type:complete len:475 (+) Transcript_2538:57-1481(+)
MRKFKSLLFALIFNNVVHGLITTPISAGIDRPTSISASRFKPLKSSLGHLIVPDSPNTQTDRLHVHFGAGRLGIGLIIPAIEAGDASYVVVQRSNKSWEEATSDGILEFQVNNEPVASGLVLLKTMEDIVSFLIVKGERKKAIALIDDLEILKVLCVRATSFSTSLGPAISTVFPLLHNLPVRPIGKRPFFYACENNHEAARAVGTLLEEKIKMRCCMVDRICTGRNISKGFVNVAAESPFKGSLVVLKISDEDSIVPFEGDNVFQPRSALESHYFYDRKVSLVNGMHTCLAFMTLREKGQTWGDHELVTYETVSDKLKEELRAWAAIRCLMLLEEHGVNVLKAAHKVETEDEVIDGLLDYSWECLNRFSSITDTTARVLGGGAGNRWATRMWPVSTFAQLKASKDSHLDQNSAGGKLMKRAGVKPEFAAKCCSELMEEGIRYCENDMKDTAQKLVDFYKNDESKSEGKNSAPA